MRISVIVAVSDNAVIGRDGDLPWRLSADLKRFKRLTMGHHLIVGRKTFDSIGRPLPGRHMIVLSRGRPQLPESVALAESLAEALQAAANAGDDEVFVAGGAEVFREALEVADRLYLTRVEAEVVGDVYFPDWSDGDWRLVSSESREADVKNIFPTRFEVWERAEPAS